MFKYTTSHAQMVTSVNDVLMLTKCGFELKMEIDVVGSTISYVGY